MACFRVARVCQRQLGFLVLLYNEVSVRLTYGKITYAYCMYIVRYGGKMTYVQWHLDVRFLNRLVILSPKAAEMFSSYICHTGAGFCPAPHQTPPELSVETDRRSSMHGFIICKLIMPVTLNPRGQHGLEAKIFVLGLVASGLGLVLVLMQCWPRPHEGCPRGLVVSHRNHVIYVTFFSDSKIVACL